MNKQTTNHKKTGFFIVIEGPDGAGHGTQAKILTEKLRDQKFNVVLTHEPGGTPFAEKLRELLLAHDLPETPDPRTELLLLAAGRAQHVERLIRPSLEANQVVVSERYYPSTYAYQHYGRRIDHSLIEKTTEIAVEGVHPDLVIVLDVSAEIGLGRKRKQTAVTGMGLDRFEQEKIEFHEKVRSGYNHLALRFGWPVIDASRSVEEVAAQVWMLVLNAMKDKGFA